MNFKEKLGIRVRQAEEVIEVFLPAEEGYQTQAARAVRYSMRAGGKRIRPVLMRESYRIFGGSEEAIEPFMAAIEMIHTHSLIHDDLPAIDDDALRRGRPSTHKVFGEAMGILSGDVLLNLAYETAFLAFERSEYPGRVTGALRILGTKAGIGGMLGGQCLDVMNEKNDTRILSREELDYIYRNKTAALLEAPLMIGALLAGASDEIVASMEAIGRSVGMAFQIRDDLLDAYGDAKVLGKPVGSDAKNQKTTYVTLLGKEAAANEVRRLLEAAKTGLSLCATDTGFLLELFSYMADRQK